MPLSNHNHPSLCQLLFLRFFSSASFNSIFFLGFDSTDPSYSPEMEHSHARALDALQPFIHLANSSSAASPRFVANLITNATSSPHTFVFAELLELPAIQALRSKGISDEYQQYLTLLELFAWGTWQEYQGKFIPSHQKYQKLTQFLQQLQISRLSTRNSRSSFVCFHSSAWPQR